MSETITRELLLESGSQKKIATLETSSTSEGTHFQKTYLSLLPQDFRELTGARLKAGHPAAGCQG